MFRPLLSFFTPFSTRLINPFNPSAYGPTFFGPVSQTGRTLDPTRPFFWEQKICHRRQQKQMQVYYGWITVGDRVLSGNGLQTFNGDRQKCCAAGSIQLFKISWYLSSWSKLSGDRKWYVFEIMSIALQISYTIVASRPASTSDSHDDNDIKSNLTPLQCDAFRDFLKNHCKYKKNCEWPLNFQWYFLRRAKKDGGQ